jgi:hypothetical protein
MPPDCCDINVELSASPEVIAERALTVSVAAFAEADCCITDEIGDSLVISHKEEETDEDINGVAVAASAGVGVSVMITEDIDITVVGSSTEV